MKDETLNLTPRQAAPASERDLANALRVLAMDAVEAAKSGHPGMPVGMAAVALALWGRHLKHNPANPAWADRARFCSGTSALRRSASRRPYETSSVAL